MSDQQLLKQLQEYKKGKKEKKTLLVPGSFRTSSFTKVEGPVTFLFNDLEC